MFAGYNLFKRAKVRRFLALQAASKWSGCILERLYPYVRDSPAAGLTVTQRFFSEGMDEIDQPWLAHIRRTTTTRRTLNFLRPELEREAFGWDPKASLCATLPEGFDRWLPSGRDQYVEAHTLMSRYLLSSQGDRMAMASSMSSSTEGSLPFLYHGMIEFANRLSSQYKLRGLTEKCLIERTMRAELPACIVQRTKQPYCSPDSSSFFEKQRPLDYVDELLSRERLESAGLFDADAVTKLTENCRSGRAFGFGDNMAFVGVLSTMPLHAQFIAPAAGPRPLI